MNDQATRVLNAAAAGLEVMAENNGIWTGKTAVENKVTAMKDKVAEIEQIDDQLSNGGGGSALKKNAKENAAIKALRIAKPMAVFAKDNNDLDLFEDIDFEWVDLRYGKDQDSIDRWQLVHDKALAQESSLIAAGYIEVGWVEELLLAINDFKDLRGKPQAKRSNVKALNQQLNLRVKELVVIKSDLVDVLVQFRESHTLFFNTVKDAFELDRTGLRHIALRIRYTDKATGVRLPLITATIVETGLSKVSSNRGIIDFTRQELAQGNYVLRSELNNYQPSEIADIGIDHEELTTLEIEMVKGAATGTGTISGIVRYAGMPVANASVMMAHGTEVNTRADGSYQFINASAGSHTVTATLPPTLPVPGPMSSQTNQVTVIAGASVQADFNF